MNFSDKYKNIVDTARKRVQPALEISDTLMREVAEKAPQGLRERITQTVIRPGKRLRSILLFLLAESNNKQNDLRRSANAAASVEMLHLASLVHDDVIDRSEERRGLHSLHSDFGNKIAVLAGDYMLAQSLIFVINEEDRRIPQCLAQAASSLVAGEISEIDLTGNFDISIDQYIEVIEGKTASLLEACGQSGAILAGYSKDIVEACGELGKHFGIAFQIIDDILDYGVGAENLGKRRFADLNNGLVTLPLLLYFQENEKEEMTQLLQKVSEPSTVNTIVQKLESGGYFSRAKAIACGHLSQASDMLNKLPDSPITEMLSEFFSAMADRSN